MLDIILIQHQKSGTNLIEYRQEHTKIAVEHADIFSGFLSAIQNITRELDIGTLILISTAGLKGHNCIIIPKAPINVIILADHDDPIDLWRDEGNKIADQFIEKYGTAFSSFNVTPFQEFKQIIKELCAGHNYCD